jgi:pimeloyl-ACP methyl ester carboxylesterase
MLRRSRVKFFRHLPALIALMTAISAVGVSQAETSAAAQGPDGIGQMVTCQRDISVPVALAAGEPASSDISGELCSTRAERHPGATVQLLIPGATYNHDYWDFGTVDGVSYSYARAVAAQGFATFAIDPLGSGRSSHPASTLITGTVAAYTDHQVVQALRAGAVGGVRFGKIIEVGHSLGSQAVWEEAITYHDVNGVIVTGMVHSIAAAFADELDTVFYPAIEDPKFASSGLDAGYITTVPGARSGLFYHAPDADPAVIALDEKRKDVASETEALDLIPLWTSTATRAITVPVLAIVGQDDFSVCGLSTTGSTFNCSSGSVVAAQEAPYYSARAELHACVVPGSGHDISLALNHGLQVADTVAWSRAFVGQFSRGGGHLPSDCS